MQRALQDASFALAVHGLLNSEESEDAQIGPHFFEPIALCIVGTAPLEKRSVLRCSGGDAILGVNWTYDEFLKIRPDAARHCHARLAELLPAVAATIAGREPSTPLRIGSTRNFMRVPHGPGWVLLGDAGYKKDPTTAQRITDAFLDVEQGSRATDAGLRGERDLTEALADWHAARDARLVPLHRMAIQMAKFATPDDNERALYAAVTRDSAETTRFLGLVSGSTDPAAYFAPERLAALLSGVA